MTRVYSEIEISPHYRNTVRAVPEFEMVLKFSANSTARTRVHLGRTEDLKALDEEVSRILRPTADQLYRATMDGFDETDGDVESPSGWFARVDWPNGRSYLISHDAVGNSSVTAEADRSDQDALNLLVLRHQALIDEYSAWTDIAEQEM